MHTPTWMHPQLRFMPSDSCPRSHGNICVRQYEQSLWEVLTSNFPGYKKKWCGIKCTLQNIKRHHNQRENQLFESYRKTNGASTARYVKFCLGNYLEIIDTTLKQHVTGGTTSPARRNCGSQDTLQWDTCRKDRILGLTKAPLNSGTTFLTSSRREKLAARVDWERNLNVFKRISIRLSILLTWKIPLAKRSCCSSTARCNQTKRDDMNSILNYGSFMFDSFVFVFPLLNPAQLWISALLVFEVPSPFLRQYL